MTKGNFTLALGGIAFLTAIITSGFTLPQANDLESNGKNSKFNLQNSCSVNSQKSSSGSQVGWTNSIPDGAGSCSSGGGCHSGGTVTPVFSFAATPAFYGNTYVPGTNYTIAIQVTGYPKFGFDLEMLDGTTSTSAAIGTFTALTHSQIKAAGSYPKSVTHTSAILSSTTATFSWIAPSSGNVYVYGDGNGVNGNGSDTGDKAVLYTLVLTPSTTIGIVENATSNLQLSAFPNPASESTTITYRLSENSEVSAKLISLTGKVVSTFFNKEQQGLGKQDRILMIDPAIAKGIYLLALEVNGKQYFKKIIVE